MDAQLCPCYFQLPTHYNPTKPGEPGREIEPEKMSRIFQAMSRQFDGWTHCGVMWGSWCGQEESSIRVCIAVLDADIPRLRQFVREIGRELGQVQMYFERGQPCVELINVEERP